MIVLLYRHDGITEGLSFSMQSVPINRTAKQLFQIFCQFKFKVFYSIRRQSSLTLNSSIYRLCIADIIAQFLQYQAYRREQ
jgi:hypothetical protein